MKTLVLGSDGRAHCLAWALARSASVDEVIGAPGNPGIASVASSCVPIDANDPEAVAQLADDLAVDLVVVSAEQPLVNGVVDAVEARGRHAFGPVAAGARLEGSKAWMKEVLSGAGVATARHAAFTIGDEDAAIAFLQTLGGLYVVKTDGLAAGKGVVVTESLVEASEAVHAYLSGAAFGEAGHTVVIEEGLTGPELSLLIVCNGDPDAAIALAPAQDFKRACDGDAGPNTGGMGAYSPVPIVHEHLVDQVLKTAVYPTLMTLADAGVSYRGVLYAGLMLTPDGPKVLEYNVRFGDPECQVVVPRLRGDFGELCLAAATGAELTADFVDDACVTVVLATEGYPAAPRPGDEIVGLDKAAAVPGVTVFHAATHQREDGVLETAGGRVLDVTAMAPSIAEARARAYEAVALIAWPGIQFRHDIAASATS